MANPSAAPTRKVGVSGAVGAATTVVVILLGQLGVDVTPELAAALATLLMFVASYLVAEPKEPPR